LRAPRSGRWTLAVGKQWHSWNQLEDANFHDDLALARTFACVEDVNQYLDRGLLKGRATWRNLC
jgi:UDP-3-O-acyl-N-acetylglucosamine deacetylase